jgi:hypothetical protein
MSAASDDVLAGLPRPLGDAAAVTSTGARHCAAAQEIGAQAKTITTSLWTGQAASSAMGYALVLASVCARVADTANETGTALRTYGTALADAQAQWDHAARLAEQAVADESAYRTRADRQAQNLVTQAAAQHESGVGAGHIANEMRMDASSYQSPLRAQAVSIATHAIQTVRGAGQTATAQVEQATNVIAPPPPPKPKPHHTPWYESAWHQVEGFGEGLYHGVLDPTKLLIGLVNPFGDQLKHWEQLGGGLATAFEHPGQFGKALIDWKDISSGQYGRWLGELAPSVAAAFATGGAAAAVKGADGVTALERVGLTAAEAGSDSGGAAQALFRADTRGPAEIFSKGFEPKGDNLDLWQHVTQNPADSGFVSTTKSLSSAQDFAEEQRLDYIYRLRAAGIDVNHTLGESSPFPWENEVAVPGSVPAGSIEGVWGPDGWLGNPRMQP